MAAARKSSTSRIAPAVASKTSLSFKAGSSSLLAESGDVWPAFPDTELWQIQVPGFCLVTLQSKKHKTYPLDHDARPSVSVAIIQGMNDYLKSAPGLPENAHQLQNEAGIKLVLTNLDDPDR